MSLKTDYKDDILAVGNLRKYQMIQNNDGTVSFQDVTQYEQTGDVFGAGDINKTNQAVNEKFDSGDVVDPMLTTEEGFAADAYKTKLQFDEQNKKSVYSTEETVIGTWVDGKPLYRKVFVGLSINTSTVGWKTIGNIDNVKEIVSSNYSIKDGDGRIRQNYPLIQLSYANNTLSTAAINDITNMTVTLTSVVVEYTKTTD